MARTLYDQSVPNHAKICARTACAQVAPHRAGRHLDQRDALYDGPDSALRGLPASVRDSARRILGDAPALMPELVDMANEIHFLRAQVAHIEVDKERQVREAAARSESCEHHGKETKELAEQLYQAGKRERRTEAARLALLGFYHAVKDAVEAYQGGKVRTAPTLEAFMGALAQFVKQAGAAHDRAWSK